MDKYILFLNNLYAREGNDFYLNLLEGKIKVAVDGGIKFFIENKIRPDIFIGDFDSSPEVDPTFIDGAEIIRHPEKKDKTDSHLALELAIERGARSIDLCGAIGTTEIDHVLGNIFLLDLINKFNNVNNDKIRAKISEPSLDVYLLSNQKMTLKGQVGDYLSILPISKKIWLELDGTEYPSPDQWIKIGDSLPLRNKLKQRRVSLSIKGKAVVILLRDSRP